MTYQGQLNSGGIAVNGPYDFTFSLFSAPTNGSQIGVTLTNSPVLVSNGLFTTTLDFGSEPFTGEGRWLEIAVRADTNAFAILSPRQALSATPYAISALSVTAPGAFSGSFTGDGSGLTNLDLAMVLAATNNLNSSLMARIDGATNALDITLSAKIGSATNDLNTTLWARMNGATNDLSLALSATINAATNDLNASLAARINAATNDLTTGMSARISAATNDLGAGLSTKVSAATNDLNTALSGRMNAATNDLNAALSSRIGAATNDLRTGLSASINNATNDLNTSLSARIDAATNAPGLASTNWVAAQGYQLTNGVTRKPITTPAPGSGTNYVVDFTNEVVHITATNNINFLQSTNRTIAGWYAESVWYIHGGAANRTVRFNTNWTKVGTLATNVPYLASSNKLTIVAVSASGSSETNVVYAITRQE